MSEELTIQSKTPGRYGIYIGTVWLVHARSRALAEILVAVLKSIPPERLLALAATKENV